MGRDFMMVDDEVSISPTFYKQLLCAKIQKRKNSVKSSVFFCLLESVHIEAAHKMLMKLTLGNVASQEIRLRHHGPLRRSARSPDGMKC